MISPERNDVDVAPLFKWYDEFIITDLDGDELETVFIRILGDADMGRARVWALRKSRDLRIKLKDLNSDERIAYIPEQGEIEDERIVEFLIISRTKKMYSDLMREISIPFPKEPASDASLEQQEKYQAEVDAYPDKVAKEVKEKIDSYHSKVRREVSEYDSDRLYNEYVKQAIDDICEAEMYDTFSDFCAFLGSYKDQGLKEKRFSSLEEFENMPRVIKKQYSACYKQLEMDMTSLKK